MTDLIEDVRTVSSDEARAPSRGDKLSFRVKTIYGSGAFVETVINTVLGNFHLFFLTVICGLSGTLAGASAFIALLVDSFVDPLVGSLSDNTRSRWGRRHPFMIAAALPISLAFVLLFAIPKQLTGWPLFAYAVGTALLLRFGISAFVIPYAAMGSELTDDYHERSVVVAFRHFFGSAAVFIPIALGFGYFLKGPNLLLRASYLPYVVTCAVIVLASALLSSLGTLGERHRLHRVENQAAGDPVGRLLRELVEVFRNRSFRILFAVLVMFFVAQGTAGVLALHANKFFWQLPPDILLYAGLALPAGQLLGIPIVTLVARWLEKRTIVLAGQFAFCIIQAAPPFLRIAGLLPPNGPFLYGLLIANAAVAGIIVTALVIGFQSMLADAADEHDLLFGARREGLYFAGLSFSVKAAAGAGVLVAGIALDAIGFPTALAAHAGAGLHIGWPILRSLGLIYGPGPALITSVCIAITWAYNIDRRRHAEIKKAIAERNLTRG